MRFPRVYAIFHPMRMSLGKWLNKLFTAIFTYCAEHHAPIPLRLQCLINDRLMYHFRQRLYFMVHGRCKCCGRYIVSHASMTRLDTSKAPNLVITDRGIYLLMMQCTGKIDKNRKRWCASFDRETGGCKLEEGSCKDIDGGLLNTDEVREERRVLLFHGFLLVTKIYSVRGLLVYRRSAEMDDAIIIFSTEAPHLSWLMFKDHVILFKGGDPDQLDDETIKGQWYGIIGGKEIYDNDREFLKGIAGIHGIE